MFFDVELTICEEDPFPYGLDDRLDPFSRSSGLRHRGTRHQKHHRKHNHHNYDDRNHWGFEDDERKSEIQKESELSKSVNDALSGITTTQLPPDPYHNGLLKDIGTVGVGFGVGVGVPGNDPVSVGTGVSVGLDESGPAGRLPPFSEAIFPRQGEQHSLNDYDGNKDLIMPSKAWHYYQGIRWGFIKAPQYEPRKSLVGVNSGVGVLGAQAPNGG
ncbi:unnamed protein product [Caenorhabditis bovis]|uniref:Uncharacterized protein n=1 Tax=Caenorhabditis bovis TaxID=2654633 RepID=A0A8S1ETE7_9PELO|nr:unnamed protein product [Caenorhabditis bovis]